MADETINVRVKLFSGLDRDAGITGYEPGEGIVLQLPVGTRLRKIIKILKLPQSSSPAYFIDGQRAGVWKRLKNDCEIICIRPAIGG